MNAAQHDSFTIEKPLLEIVIVSYRSRELLSTCLASLEYFPLRRGPFVVHVVDNDSCDGTSEMLAADFPDVRVKSLNHNAGFAEANNLALRQTRAPYVLLLNPDTELREGILDHLVEVLEADETIGMIGCRLEQLDGNFDHASKRSFPTPLAALGHFIGVGRRAGARGRLAAYRAPALGEREFGDVDAVNGAFMLVRRRAMDEVGLFDAGYWLYMEDLDWCYRFHRRGWRVVYDGRVTALHVKGGTSGKRRRLLQNVAFHRGMGRFYRKFLAGANRPLDVLVYCGIVGKGTVSVTRNAIIGVLERGDRALSTRRSP